MILPTPADLSLVLNSLKHAIEAVAQAESVLLTAKAALEDRRSAATLQNLITGSNEQARKASERAILAVEHAAILVAERDLNSAKAAKAGAELNWLHQQALMRLAEITASPIGSLVSDELVDPRRNMEVVQWNNS